APSIRNLPAAPKPRLREDSQPTLRPFGSAGYQGAPRTSPDRARAAAAGRQVNPYRPVSRTPRGDDADAVVDAAPSSVRRAGYARHPAITRRACHARLPDNAASALPAGFQPVTGATVGPPRATQVTHMPAMPARHSPRADQAQGGP